MLQKILYFFHEAEAFGAKGRVIIYDRGAGANSGVGDINFSARKFSKTPTFKKYLILHTKGVLEADSMLQ